MKKILPLLAVAALAAACGGKHSTTELLLMDWGRALNTHLATSQYHEFPERLDEIEEDLRSFLSEEDAWGNRIYYRKMRDDQYQIISAGPNGTLGDDDDIISANGKLQDPAKIYADEPIN